VEILLIEQEYQNNILYKKMIIGLIDVLVDTIVQLESLCDLYSSLFRIIFLLRNQLIEMNEE
jgi:hypothetical protein